MERPFWRYSIALSSDRSFERGSPSAIVRTQQVFESRRVGIAVNDDIRFGDVGRSRRESGFNMALKVSESVDRLYNHNVFTIICFYIDLWICDI